MSFFQFKSQLPLSKQLGRAFLLLSVILALFILLLAANFIKPSTKGEQKGKAVKNVFIASGHPELAPIAFRSGSEGLAGVGVDITKKIFDGLKSPLEFKYTGNWEEVLAKAKTGEVDVIVGIDQSKDAMEYLSFTSIPYAEAPVSLFVAKNKKSNYKGWDSLAGKKGVALVGNSFGPEFDDLLKANKIDIKRASTSLEALKLVADGQADYFINSLYAGQKTLAGDTALAEKIKIVPESLTTQKFFIAISNQSPYADKLAEVSKALYEQKTEVNHLMNKYTYYYLQNDEAK